VFGRLPVEGSVAYRSVVSAFFSQLHMARLTGSLYELSDSRGNGVVTVSSGIVGGQRIAMAPLRSEWNTLQLRKGSHSVLRNFAVKMRYPQYSYPLSKIDRIFGRWYSPVPRNSLFAKRSLFVAIWPRGFSYDFAKDGR
jgi:hypothetical protein